MRREWSIWRRDARNGVRSDLRQRIVHAAVPSTYLQWRFGPGTCSPPQVSSSHAHILARAGLKPKGQSCVRVPSASTVGGGIAPGSSSGITGSPTASACSRSAMAVKISSPAATSLAVPTAPGLLEAAIALADLAALGAESSDRCVVKEGRGGGFAVGGQEGRGSAADCSAGSAANCRGTGAGTGAGRA